MIKIFSFYKYCIFSLVFTLLLVACHKKNIRKQDVSKKSVSRDLVQEIISNNLDYETLRIKGKCTFKQDKQQIQFTYRIHIEKGKKIWASLSGFGIEAVRAMVEGDSAAYFNRLQNTYWKGNIKELSQKFGIQGDISILEAIFIGNFFLNQVDKIQNTPLQTEISASFNQIPIQFSINNDQKIQKIQIHDLQNGWKSFLIYENFQVFYNKLVPLKLNIQVSEPQLIQINLEHKEIEVNPKDLKFTFQIPDDFRPINQ